MKKRFTLKLMAICALLASAAVPFGLAQAQTKLKWAHVYETSEPYPQVVGLGRRRDQEAHQRQVRDPGVPGLQPGQGIATSTRA